MNQQVSQLICLFENAKTQSTKFYELLEVGRNSGFQNITNRKKIWPFLLKVNMDLLGDSGIFQWKEKMERNSKDYQQLQKDAERSLSNMKTFQNTTPFHLKKRQESVLAVLDTFFARNKQLRYIQGFHDIACIFLIIYGTNLGYYMMEKAANIYFKDFLIYDFGHLTNILSMMVHQMVITKDPIFQKILKSFENIKTLTFAISWILTWFSHVFSSVKTICRIWDYILSTGPQGVLYLTAAIILSCKAQIMKFAPKFQHQDILMFYQNKMKKQSIDIEQSIRIAIEIQSEINFKQLINYKQLQPQSIFRLEVFYVNNPNYQKFHIHLKQKQKRNKFIKKAAISLSVIAVAAFGLYFAHKSGKIPFKFLKNAQL